MSSGITVFFRNATGEVCAATGNFLVQQLAIRTIGENELLKGKPTLNALMEPLFKKGANIDEDKPLIFKNILRITVPGVQGNGNPDDFFAPHVTMEEYEDKLRDAMKLKIGVVSLDKVQDENAKKALKLTL